MGEGPLCRTGSFALLLVGIALLLVIGCQPAVAQESQNEIPVPVASEAVVTPIVLPTGAELLPTPPSLTVPPAGPSSTPPLTPTPQPTVPPPPPIATATPTIAPIPTIAPECANRIPSPDDLLVVVTKAYGISRAFVPPDLVPLSDYFPFDVTLGYPTLAREIIMGPLVEMVSDMQAAGLEPQLVSGYRDYYTQQLSYQKWAAQFPERVDQLSAPPGHSEHQLGTTVDFTSPSLADYIEDEALKKQQFHTHFYMTPEGQWLLDNAHRYGFTLSYPREAVELTGFTYEPWHYRFVGVAMATQLKQSEQTLTEFQLLSAPNPCR